MACRKMNEDVAYARNTESGCKAPLVISPFSPVDNLKLTKSKYIWKTFFYSTYKLPRI